MIERGWPELAILLGIVGWQFLGPSIAFLIPPLLGVFARILDVYHWALRVGETAS
jgi:hypothetical protein